MAAGSVWKGLVGLGLFALAHAAFSAAQRESPPGERPGAPAPPRGPRGAPGAGAGPGRHHHRPEARARRRGRPCPWGRAAGRAEPPEGARGSARAGLRGEPTPLGERGARPAAAGKGGENGGWEGGAAPAGSRLQPGLCRPAPSRLSAGGPAALRGSGTGGCPGRVRLPRGSAAVSLGVRVAGLFVGVHRVFDACLCFCFVDRSYMRLTEKEDETLPIDVSFCTV